MKPLTVILLLISFGLLSVVTAQSKNGASYYCGQRLAVALDFVCDGNLIKRSEPRPRSLQRAWPRLLPISALSAGSRRKRQVVEECCEKPCTEDELATYCGV